MEKDTVELVLIPVARFVPGTSGKSSSRVVSGRLRPFTRSAGFGDGRVRKVGDQLAKQLPGFPVILLGDVNPLPNLESREPSCFRFIGPAGNPLIVNERIARGFCLGDSLDLNG